MQSNKSSDMQSDMHLSKQKKGNVDNAQNAVPRNLRVRRFQRTYHACKGKTKKHKPKEPQTVEDHQTGVLFRDVPREDSKSRACTPSGIDLPTLSKEVEDKSRPLDISHSQTNFLPPASKDLVDFSEAECSNDSLAHEDVNLRDCHIYYHSRDNTQGETENLALDPTTVNIRDGDGSFSRREKKNKGLAKQRDRRRNESQNSIADVKGHHQIKRPQHRVLGFMEDHAEFGSDWEESSSCRGRYLSSVLESTVDGSIIKGARRYFILHFNHRILIVDH